MRRITLLFTILLLSAALPLVAQPQQQESLGDLARQLREQHDKDAKKATKVFTNDNLPAPKPGEAISSSPRPPRESFNSRANRFQTRHSPGVQETGSNQPVSRGQSQNARLLAREVQSGPAGCGKGQRAATTCGR